MKKRTLSVLIALVMVLGLLSTTAFAQNEPQSASTTVDYSKKAIQLGTSGLKSPTKITVEGKGDYYAPNSYIYFGKNSNDGNNPVKWRVLDADAANDGSKNGMFLLSEYLLTATQVFIYQARYGNAYNESDIRSLCTSYAYAYDMFTKKEQDAMLAITKTDEAATLYGSNWGTSNLDEDKVFPLSVQELADYVGNYQYAPGLVANLQSSRAFTWWLRSPFVYSNWKHLAASVSYTGKVDSQHVEDNCGIRPAINLNTDSVLFISDAKGVLLDMEKSSNLTAVGTNETNEWRLTLLDSSRNFSVTEKSVTGKCGDTLTLHYSGAVSKVYNEFVSVILVNDSGEAIYYGRIARKTESGAAEMIIPAGLEDGRYTLKVFSEKTCWGYGTDYASAFVDVALTVTGGHKHAWSSDWSSDDTAHWHECTAKSCPITENSKKNGYTEHSGGTATCKDKAVCDVCGKQYGELEAHNYDTAWTADSKNHWHGCSVCGDKKDIASHVDADNDHTCDVCGKLIALHSDSNNDHICDSCGVVFMSHMGGTATCKDKAICMICGKPYGDLAAHSYKAEWSNDDSGHWHECSVCGIKTDSGEHVFDTSKHEECTICGYKKVSALYYGIEPGTTVEELKKKLGDGVTITGAKNGLIGTGTKIIIGGIEQTVIIKGDIDGDGKITSNDYIKVRLHVTNRTKLEGASLLAAHVTTEVGKTVLVSDYVAIRQHILKKKLIAQ